MGSCSGGMGSRGSDACCGRGDVGSRRRRLTSGAGQTLVVICDREAETYISAGST
jgi:hypothetical protein